MNYTLLKRLLPFVCGAALLVTGCGQHEPVQASSDGAPTAKVEAQAQANVLKGKIVGKSNKAKTISIEVGKGDKAKTLMVKFNDDTQGVEHAVKGHAAIIQYSGEGKNKVATVIKPKLAKLPKGTSEMKPSELIVAMQSGKEMVLVDARPSKRFHEGTIPGSINIPVPAMKEKAAKMLPKDKDIQLVFFCGGPT